MKYPEHIMKEAMDEHEENMAVSGRSVCTGSIPLVKFIVDEILLDRLGYTMEWLEIDDTHYEIKIYCPAKN